MQYYRHHERQWQRLFDRSRVLDMTLQNADDVAQQAERHQLVWAALVLEEDVEQRGVTRDVHRK